MPKGPKGQKRPADVVGNAILVAKIATGEVDEEGEAEPESPAATLGRKGGFARAQQLTPEQRTEMAKKAASMRWKGSKA